MTNTLAGSVSRMQAYQECPRGALGRALRLEAPGPKPDYLLTGSVHHERAAARLFTGTWPVASEIEGWHPGLDADLAYLEQRTEEVIQLIDLDKATDVQVEQRVAFREDWTRCEWDDPDTYWRQIADLAYTDPDGARHIEDWKTSRKVLKGIPDAMRFQIMSYGIEPMLEGYDPIIGVVHQVRGGPWGSRQMTMHSEQVAETMVAIEGWMTVWRSRPEDDPLAWPATPCRMCDGCAFAPDCPELQGSLAGTHGVPETPEQVVEMALAMEAHEKVAGAMKRLLEEATERLGPVPLPTGKLIGHFPIESRVLDDPPGVLDDLVEAGAKREDLEKRAIEGMTVTKVNDLAKLVKWKRGQKKKSIDAILDARGHVEVSTRFTQKANDEAEEET